LPSTVATEQTKRPRGCFFYGVLAALIVFGLIMGAAFVGLHLAKRLLNQFTDTKPAPLPVVQVSPAESAELQNRVRAFRQAVDRGFPTQPLALTAKDINVLLATDKDFQAFRGKLYVTIESNEVQVQVSAPMEDLGMAMFAGRYLNGTGTLTASLQDGKLQVTLQSLTAKGRPMPEPYMKKIRQQNLAQSVNNDAQGKTALQRLETVEIRDGRLLIVPVNPPTL